MDLSGIWELQPSFPRSLNRLNAKEILAAIKHRPQGDVHSNIVEEIVDHSPEAEILQQNSDFAILRVCPGRFRNVGHYIIGYADERGLFIHNVPSGDIDLCSEPMWYILQWLNRREEGFHRIQGDLLLRKIKDPWEIEQIELKEKEEPPFFHAPYYPGVTLGNGHNIEGTVTAVQDDNGRDPRVIAKVGGKRGEKTSKEVRVRHREHREVHRRSEKKEYHEAGMQKRGEDGDWRGDD